MTQSTGGVTAEPEPFEQIPHWVLFSAISPQAIRLYLVLKRRADKRGMCYPGRKTIARELGVSNEKTVDRAMRELEDLGAVEVQRRTTEAGDYTSNLYLVRWSDPRTQVVPSSTPPSPTTGTTGGPTKRRLTHTQGEPDPRTRPRELARSTSAEFEEFWQQYPRRVGKRAAEKAWSSAIKTAPPAVIIAGAIAYANDPNREDTFTAHPSTWLNAGRWDDDPIPERTSGKKSGTRIYLEVAQELRKQAAPEWAGMLEAR